MPWQHDPEVIVPILREAGFDTIISQTINGIRDEGDTNHQVFINSQGRIRYQFSELINHTSRTITLFDKEFNIDKENRDIINIIGELESYDDLVRFLRSVPEITRKDIVK